MTHLSGSAEIEEQGLTDMYFLLARVLSRPVGVLLE